MKKKKLDVLLKQERLLSRVEQLEKRLTSTRIRLLKLESKLDKFEEKYKEGYVQIAANVHNRPFPKWAEDQAELDMIGECL